MISLLLIEWVVTVAVIIDDISDIPGLCFFVFMSLSIKEYCWTLKLTLLMAVPLPLIQETCDLCAWRSSLWSAPALNILLCPNRQFSIWDRLGCLENTFLRQGKSAETCQKELTVCISDHYRDTQSFVVAVGCNLLLEKRIFLFLLTKLLKISIYSNPAFPCCDIFLRDLFVLRQTWLYKT